MEEKRTAGVGAAVRLWARREIGGRWRALVVLGVLAGAAAGLALAAVAGARRTSAAYARFREATGRSDAVVFATQVGVFGADYSPIRRLPEVADAGEFLLAPVGIKEAPQGFGSLAPGDDHLYRSINRPLVVAGRLPDPRRDDEILVNRAAAKRLHLNLGNRVTLVSSKDQAGFFGKPLDDGPSVRATVVGIGDSNMDLAFAEGGPAFIPSFGFFDRHPEVPRAGNLVVRLRPGTDITAFRRHVADAMGLPTIPVRDQAEDTKRIVHGTDLERTALLLFAAAVALAGLVLVGQALGRSVYAMAETVPTLRALGLTRANLVAGLAVPLSVPAAVGALVTVGTAVGMSPQFPLGLAGRLEPDRGLHADWPVLAPGAAALVIAVVAGAVLAALRATAAHRHRAPVGVRISRLRALRAWAPIPAGIGAALAVERGRGLRALPVRPALVGATAGVVGIIGAFGLLGGIDDALGKPERAGQVWDADVFLDDGHPEAPVVAAAESEPTVIAAARMRRSDVDVDGAGLPVYAVDPLKGNQSFVVLRGRSPAAPTDAVLGPATARALHRRIGDSVRIGGPEGREARVVGLGLLPQTAHSSFDQGVWMSSEGLHAVAPTLATPQDYTIVVRFASRRSLETGIDRLQQRLGGDADIEGFSPPQDVTLLRNVRGLPKALAAFLVFLGLCAMAHALLSAVRRRRHDLAVLRAVGFRPLQVAACVLWQALTVSVVVLALGIPLGSSPGDGRGGGWPTPRRCTTSLPSP